MISYSRIKPDGEGSAPVLVTHNDGLVSMSFDWVSKQLYYVDNIRNSLEVYGRFESTVASRYGRLRDTSITSRTVWRYAVVVRVR